ncbi:MAG TPA: SpoIIE family protein phosphatase [Armatimonadota bacterium]|jgi:serine phosphatase RsbU (regulator of sigma subunit)/putative methionine-R-sulfoxide reductase with GAF domain
MKPASENMYDLPDHPSDARIVELASQLRSVQAELRRQEASATENAKLFAQANARLRELSALNKVARAIQTTLDLPELLQIALEQTVQVTDADTGSIMLLQPGTDTMKIAAAHGLSGDIVNAAAVTVGAGVAGWVAKNRKPLLVPNVASDPRFSAVVPRAEIKSSMSVPVLTRFEVLGVLNVARSSSNRPFSSQDLQLLTTLSGQISLAVENARLFEAERARNEELRTLMDLSAQLNGTLNLREVVEIIVEQSCALVHADAGAVFLGDDRNDVLRVRGMRRLSAQFFRKVRGKLGHGLIGDVADSGIPEYVENIAASPRLEYADVQVAEGLVSMLCVPLRTGGQSLGAVAIYSRKTRHWEDHELNMLMALAGQGAMAVHNAGTYQSQLGIAKLVEQNLAPQMKFPADGPDIGHRYLPAKQVGGDYYDVFGLPEGRLGLLMADVAGKSVQAAVHTAKGKYFIRALGHEGESPAVVLSRTNALIHADTRIEMFISVFYGILEADNRLLRYCNAGHPAPIIVHKDQSMTELAQADLLIGILASPPYTEHTVDLLPGDTVILTTDGVTEARGDAGMYGAESLHQCIVSRTYPTAQSLADSIVEDVLRHSGPRMRDDIAVLVIRV